MDYTGILIVAALLGCITGAIAQRKGHSFGTWWLFGALLFIVALPLALMAEPNEEARRQCPHCRTWIDREASVCPQCSRDVEPAAAAAAAVDGPAAGRPWEAPVTEPLPSIARQVVLGLGGVAILGMVLLVTGIID